MGAQYATRSFKLVPCDDNEVSLPLLWRKILAPLRVHWPARQRGTRRREHSSGELTLRNTKTWPLTRLKVSLIQNNERKFSMLLVCAIGLGALARRDLPFGKPTAGRSVCIVSVDILPDVSARSLLPTRMTNRHFDAVCLSACLDKSIWRNELADWNRHLYTACVVLNIWRAWDHSGRL